MVIGEKFAWAHIPKTGGDSTHLLFRDLDDASLRFIDGPEQGEMAAYVNIRNYSGYQERDRLISPELNFYGHKEVTLDFQYAYKR